MVHEKSSQISFTSHKAGYGTAIVTLDRGASLASGISFSLDMDCFSHMQNLPEKVQTEVLRMCSKQARRKLLPLKAYFEV